MPSLPDTRWQDAFGVDELFTLRFHACHCLMVRRSHRHKLETLGRKDGYPWMSTWRATYDGVNDECDRLDAQRSA